MSTRDIPVDVWLPRFAARLRELMPGISAADAIGIALSMYDIANDRPPEDVAADYARDASASDGKH